MQREVQNDIQHTERFLFDTINWDCAVYRCSDYAVLSRIQLSTYWSYRWNVYCHIFFYTHNIHFVIHNLFVPTGKQLRTYWPQLSTATWVLMLLLFFDDLSTVTSLLLLCDGKLAFIFLLFCLIIIKMFGMRTRDELSASCQGHTPSPSTLGTLRSDQTSL